MKKQYFLIVGFLVYGLTNAQIINFPDANFKAKLLEADITNEIASTSMGSGSGIKLDANSDGEIEVSETISVISLDVSFSNISSLEGIENFANLVGLRCNNNLLTTLDLTYRPNFEFVDCSHNLLTEVHFPPIFDEGIVVSYNLIETLEVKSINGIGVFYILDCSNNPNLVTLFIKEANIETIQGPGTIMANTLANCPNLNYICAKQSDFANIQIILNQNGNDNCLVNSTCSNFITFTDPNFKTKLLLSDETNEIVTDEGGNGFKLDINNNSEIEYTEALNVIRMNVDNANINSLGGIEHFTTLTMLDCSYNQLSTLDLTFREYMLSINCSNNLLTSVDFPPVIDEGVVISNNLIETLHLESYLGFGPGIPSFFMFDCSNNPNLQSLFIKDAYIETIYSPNYFDPVYLSNCPNLSYICTKDSDIPNVLLAMNTNGNSNCVVNSYCTFNPLEQSYVVQGNVKVDFNGNGCNVSDTIYPNFNLAVTNGSNSGNYIANASGTYSIPLSSGSYTITPVFENPNYYSVSPTSITVTFPNTSAVFLQDFCLTPQPINDVEVTILPLNASTPGFISSFKIKYKNKGQTTQSGTVSFTFNGSILQLYSATPSATTSMVNSLTWNFSNLLPLESREIIILLDLNSPTETPPVNSGTILNFSSSISGIGSDFHPEDNTFSLVKTVVNSFDPNDKTCLEGKTINPSQVGKYVHYMIRFENTGTANAQNIVVKDIIDTTKFDLASLILIDGSHLFVTRITNTNQVEFIFENIQLPFDDANNDGYVAFKIKTKPNLILGNTFSNTASIYFDYNFPIITNTAVTTIANPLSNQDFEFESYFSVSPNPVKSQLNIITKQNITISSISIYNTLGQLVQVIPNAIETSIIDVSSLKSGNYFIKIITQKGTSTSTFIKE